MEDLFRRFKELENRLRDLSGTVQNEIPHTVSPSIIDDIIDQFKKDSADFNRDLVILFEDVTWKIGNR